MGIYLFSLCLLSTTTTTIENFFSTFRLIKENPANIFFFSLSHWADFVTSRQSNGAFVHIKSTARLTLAHSHLQPPRMKRRIDEIQNWKTSRILYTGATKKKQHPFISSSVCLFNFAIIIFYPWFFRECFSHRLPSLYVLSYSVNIGYDGNITTIKIKTKDERYSPLLRSSATSAKTRTSNILL